MMSCSTAGGRPSSAGSTIGALTVTNVVIATVRR
jgi:hypothetical protein